MSDSGPGAVAESSTERSQIAGPLTGRILGDFIVRDKVGEGGFGAVYRAEQPALGREAIVKILHSRHEKGDQLVQRFLREARLASTLDHPFAAHIYAFGVEPDGVLWIAMELVRGTPLDRLLKEHGPFSLARFVPLLDRICEVVHTAHEQGIIHRDIKPANVMVLSRAGRLSPKLLDFGIAKLRDGVASTGQVEQQRLESVSKEPHNADRSINSGLDGMAGVTTSKLTQRGVFIGSPQYMAPEQWMDAGSADAQTDIYALGALTFEALTGHAPFEGSVREIALGHAKSAVPALGPGFPLELYAVMNRAMAKKRQERFATALEFASAFWAAAHLEDQPEHLPQLEDSVRETVIAEGPQPVAEGVTALEVAPNVFLALDALQQVFRIVARYLGVIALSCRTRIATGLVADSPETITLLQALRRDQLKDAEWVELAQALCRPFAANRAAYPIPELVSFFFRAGGEIPSGNSGLFVFLGAEPGLAGPKARERLAGGLGQLARLLRAVSFLIEYPLVVVARKNAERWTGARRGRRPVIKIEARRVQEGRVLLVNRQGVPVLTLWPLVQAMAPTPGASEELFFLEGNGRHGAKLVSFPLNFERHDESLWDWYRAELLEVSDAEKDSAAKERAPYLGLASFSASDAGNFFGRELEADAFANRLRIQPLLGVVGPSGSGKSSFIQAGVVPLMPAQWRIVTVRPGPSPISALLARLAGEGVDVENLPRELGRSPNALGERLHGFARSKGCTLLLVVDQFEELITLCQDNHERHLYSSALAAAAVEPEASLRIVLTLRDDFLIRAQQLTGLRQRLAQGLQLLGTPEPEDLMRILIEPARRAGYQFEDLELPKEMVDAVAEQPGALALLSFTASKLWELRDRHFRRFSRPAYESLGGVGGALGHHAEATLAAMSPEEQPLVREVFRHLVTAEGTRAVMTRRELEQVSGGGEAAQQVLERLIQARLLVASEGEKEDRVEVIHEALIASWPRLVKWLREDVESVRMRDQLRAAARQWEERQRGKGLLWRKEALMEYRLWRSRYPGRLTDTEEAFAAASLRDEARGRRIRRTLLVSAFVILALGVLVLLRATRESQKRLAESYFEQGRQLMLSEDPVRGLLYLQEARRTGADSPGLRYLMARATRAIEAQTASLPHSDHVLSVEFDAEGNRVVSGSWDGTAKVWDAHTGKLIAAFVGHRGKVWTARFIQNGAQVLTSSSDGTARVWNPLDGTVLATLNVSAPNTWWAFAEISPDGKLIVAGINRIAKVWDARSFELLRELPPASADLKVAFFLSGHQVVIGGRDGVVGIWDLDSGTLVRPLAGHHGNVWCISKTPDERRLAVIAQDGIATVWNLSTGQLLSQVTEPPEAVGSVALNPDGKSMMTTSDDRNVRIWKPETGELLRLLEGHTAGVRFGTFNSDGKRILTASVDATAKLWDASNGRLLMSLAGHVGTVYQAKFSPGEERAVTAAFDGTAKVWDLRKGPIQHQFSAREGDVHFANFSADGSRLFAVGEGGDVRIWDLATGQLQLEWQSAVPNVVTAAVSPDEDKIAIIGDENGKAKLFALHSGQLLMTYGPHADKNSWVDFSPDGKRLLTGSKDRTMKIWDVTTGKELLILQGHAGIVTFASFSPDGKSIISASDDKTVRLWDSESGALRWMLSDFKGTVYSATFSPDGAKFVTASRDKRVAIWDTRTRKRLLNFQETKLPESNSARFDPTGQLVVTAEIDGNARVWELQSGRLVGVLGHGKRPLDIAHFSRDARHIVTAGEGGALVWDAKFETRSESQIDALIRCYLPLKIESGLIFPQPADPSACATVSAQR